MGKKVTNQEREREREREMPKSTNIELKREIGNLISNKTVIYSLTCNALSTLPKKYFLIEI